MDKKEPAWVAKLVQQLAEGSESARRGELDQATLARLHGVVSAAEHWMIPRGFVPSSRGYFLSHDQILTRDKALHDRMRLYLEADGEHYLDSPNGFTRLCNLVAKSMGWQRGEVALYGRHIDGYVVNVVSGTIRKSTSVKQST